MFVPRLAVGEDVERGTNFQNIRFCRFPETILIKIYKILTMARFRKNLRFLLTVIFALVFDLWRRSNSNPQNPQIFRFWETQNRNPIQPKMKF